MRILYIVDGINYLGGANVATAALVSELLKRGVEIDVLTDVEPTDKTRLAYSDAKIFPFPQKRWTFAWLVQGVLKKLFGVYVFPNWTVDPDGKIRTLMRCYDCVCVMSELSIYRKLVASLGSRVRKVQLIHSDYFQMQKVDRYANAVCKKDLHIFANADVIGVVGECNASRMANRFPQFAWKIKYFYNYIPTLAIQKSVIHNGGVMKLVSAISFDSVAKDPSRLVRMAIRLLQTVHSLDWTIYGDGASRKELEQEVQRCGLQNAIHLPGINLNLRSALPEFDLLVLLSHYEGLPMVIYEALIAGVPVAATDVGDIRCQLGDGKLGWLLKDDEESIYAGLSEILTNSGKIDEVKAKLKSYDYDNESVIKQHLKILGATNVK